MILIFDILAIETEMRLRSKNPEGRHPADNILSLQASEGSGSACLK